MQELPRNILKVTYGECWPRSVDPADASTGSQYEGWPKTIEMTDNFGRGIIAWLPELRFEGMEKPVVMIYSNDELLYSLRIQTNSFRPFVFDEGYYSIVCGEPGTDKIKEFTDVEAEYDNWDDFLEIDFQE